jgi:hypothetical protein
MHIYKVTRTDEVGYDEYRGFVCVAQSQDQARLIHPNDEVYQVTWCAARKIWIDKLGGTDTAAWTADLDSLEVEYVGDTTVPTAYVVMHSFRAG